MFTPPPRSASILEPVPAPSQGEYIKRLIASGSGADIETLVHIMSGHTYELDYSGVYYNSRQALSWQMWSDVYAILVMGLFESFQNHIVLTPTPIAAEDLSAYRGKYILNTQLLADLIAPTMGCLGVRAISNTVLFYVNESGEKEFVNLTNCTPLKERVGDLTNRALHLSHGDFNYLITSRGKHVQKSPPPEIISPSSQEMQSLKAEVFSDIQVSYTDSFLRFAEKENLMAQYAATEGASTPEPHLEAAAGYASAFSSAWLQYMGLWLEDADLSKIQTLFERGKTKWARFLDYAGDRRETYLTEKGTKANHFELISAEMAETTPPHHLHKIGPLDPLDEAGTTALHLALANKNTLLIDELFKIISAQRSSSPSYETILAMVDANGKSINDLFTEMGTDGVFAKAKLQIYCNSTPLGATDNRSIFSPRTPSDSIISGEQRRRSSVIDPIPFTMGSAASGTVDDLEGLDALDKAMHPIATTPLAGPFKDIDARLNLAFACIDQNDGEVLRLLIDPDRRHAAAVEINFIHQNLIQEMNDQTDYPLDLLRLWHIHMEYKLHKLLYDRLTADPAPEITSNADLERIRDEVFTELKEMALTRFMKYDQQRKRAFAGKEAELAPILATFCDAIQIFDLGFSARIFDHGKLFSENIAALSNLRSLLRHKETDYNQARRACLSHTEASALAVSIWMQDWQKQRQAEGRPLPFSVDMREHALNNDLAWLIDGKPLDILTQDQYGNTLLHRAAWQNNDTLYKMLLTMLLPTPRPWPKEQHVSPSLSVDTFTLGIPNHLGMTPRQIRAASELYPDLIGTLESLINDIQRYETQVMQKKDTAHQKLMNGDLLPRLYNWFSIHITGKDQIAIRAHRQGALAEIRHTLNIIRAHFSQARATEGRGPQTLSSKILVTAVQLQDTIGRILPAVESRKGRFATVLSPLSGERFSSLRGNSPRLARIPETPETTTRPGRASTDSPVPFDFDSTDQGRGVDIELTSTQAVPVLTGQTTNHLDTPAAAEPGGTTL